MAMFKINEKKIKSTDIKLSRYNQGGLTDVYVARLGFWDRIAFDPATDDIIYTITKDVEKRPDLISYKLYGKVALSWLVLQYNAIVDVEVEMVAGKRLVLPSPTRVTMDMTNQRVGGVKIE